VGQVPQCHVALHKKRNILTLLDEKPAVLDVVVNKPFKVNLCKRFTERLLSGDHSLTPTGKLKKPAVHLLCTWILQAWDAIH